MEDDLKLSEYPLRFIGYQDMNQHNFKNEGMKTSCNCL